MKRSALIVLTLTLCAAAPSWSQTAQPVSAQQAEAATQPLLTPPVPPGKPVPLNTPIKLTVVPPLNIDLSKPLTVECALQVAFQKNPDIRVAMDVAQRAVGTVAEAVAGFNPRFNLQLEHIEQPESKATMPAAGPDQPETTFVIQQPSTTTAGVAATLPLDISRRVSLTTEVARYQFDIQYLNMVAASERLIQNVKTAYYDMLRACGQAKVAQSAVDVAKVRLDNTVARYEAGTVPKFDVTTAQVDLANLNQQLIQAQTRVETARTTLNRQLGIEINNPTQIVDYTPTVEQGAIDVNKETDIALLRRPEVRAANTAIALNQRNVKLQQTGLKPSLNWNVNLGYNVNTTTFANQNVNWQTSLVLSAPLWDGGATKARVAQARADVSNAADTLDQTKLAVGVDVRNAILGLEEAARRTQTTAEAVTLAEEALRLANVRYEAGIAVLVEVTNAESQLTQARFNYVNAQYDYATALANLQRATSTQPELNQVQLLNPRRLKI